MARHFGETSRMPCTTVVAGDPLWQRKQHISGNTVRPLRCTAAIIALGRHRNRILGEIDFPHSGTQESDRARHSVHLSQGRTEIRPMAPRKPGEHPPLLHPTPRSAFGCPTARANHRLKILAGLDNGAKTGEAAPWRDRRYLPHDRNSTLLDVDGQRHGRRAEEEEDSRPLQTN